jgi:hypothetical protein
MYAMPATQAHEIAERTTVGTLLAPAALAVWTTMTCRALAAGVHDAVLAFVTAVAAPTVRCVGAEIAT